MRRRMRKYEPGFRPKFQILISNLAMVLNPSPDSVTSQPSVMIIYLIFEEKFSEAATDKTNHKAKLQISKIFLLRNNSEGPGESFPEFEFHKRIATSRIREGMDRMGIGEA